MSRGVFFSIEGLDGTGKTTVTSLLARALKRVGFDVLHTREPGGTHVGEKIREILLTDTSLSEKTEVLLFLAARSHHVDTVIRPALQAGQVVLCERFIDTTVAYQGALRKIERGRIDGLNQWAIGDVMPHRTYLFDNDPEVSFARLPHGDTDEMGTQFMKHFNLLRQAFLQIADENPSRIMVVDSAPPEVTVLTTIYADARRVLREYGLAPTPNPEAPDSAPERPEEARQ